MSAECEAEPPTAGALPSPQREVHSRTLALAGSALRRTWLLFFLMRVFVTGERREGERELERETKRKKNRGEREGKS